MKQNVIRRWLALSIVAALCGCSKPGSSSTSEAPSTSSDSGSATSAPSPLVVIAGTQLVVTVDQDVSTKTNATGDRFAASLAEPVTVDGTVVLPKGARARGTVTASKQAGRIKGGSSLAITLDSVTVNGQTYSIATSTYEQTGKGRGKRTAVGGGGGAAAGAIIGALAGGGKGAAIGALAGGGAGTAGAAYTGNRDITIAAETRVHFKLKEAVSIPQQ